MQLMVDVDDLLLQIDIRNGQTAELRDTHPGMEKDVYHFVVFAVNHIVMYELEEFPHLILCQSLSHDGVIEDNPYKLESERIL